MRHTSTGVTINASVSPRAERFVAFEAIKHLANGEVWIDDWSTPPAPHVWREGRTGASQCIIVFPATLDTVMRLSQGRADSPALMMMQITSLPLIIADVIPANNAVIDHWRDVLALRPNVAFAPRLEAIRASDRGSEESGLNLPGALAKANEYLRHGEFE